MATASRRFTIVEVPDPVEIKAEFVYNFFTPDERTNDAGDLRVPGIGRTREATEETIRKRSLKLKVPRYVNINFKPAQSVDFNNFGDAKETTDLSKFLKEGKVSSEESITNEPFASVRESDPDATKRLSEKVKSLSNALNLDFSDSHQSEKLSQILGVDQGWIQKLISPYENQKDLQVNFKPDVSQATLFDIASQLSLTSLVSKRVLGVATLGGDDVSPLSRTGDKSIGNQIASDFLSSADSVNLTDSDFEAALTPFKTVTDGIESNDTVRIMAATTVGYILIRKQLAPSGRCPDPGPTGLSNPQTFVLSGRESTSFIDSKVAYGTKYVYSVRAVYRVDAIVSTGKDKKSQIATLIASRPSAAVTVVTEEYQAPEFPDGVFYNFHYSKGRGLIMTWQIPSGRSRDVKFFQVFRRRSIYEPFQCLAEIDFDDSGIPTLRPERVRPDLVIKSKGPQTMFEDRSFNRDSADAIYAVCAVDAHGLTSGYSAQTQVGFNKTSNILTLKNISRPGAPKQYPNFFIDPDLDDNIAVDSFSQDAIFDSGHTRMDVYFTPDTIEATDDKGKIINALVTNKSEGTYQVHFLNLDLQKSTTAEIRVSDKRDEI